MENNVTDLLIGTDDVDKNAAVKAFDYPGMSGLDLSNSYDAFVNKDINKNIVATPKLTEFMEEGEIETAAVAEDIDKLSDIERFIYKMSPSRIKEKTVTSTDVNKDTFYLMNYDAGFNVGQSKINNDVEREELNLRIKENKEKLKELSMYDKPEDFWIDVPPGAAGLFVQIADAVENNKALAAQSALVGGMFGGPLVAAAAVLTTTGAVDNYEITAGEIMRTAYYEQDKEIRDQLDHVEVAHIAHGAAFLSAGIEALSLGALLKSVNKAKSFIPFVKNLSGRGIAHLIKTQGIKSPVLQGLGYLGKTLTKNAIEQGGAEYLQEQVSQGAKVIIDPSKDLNLETAKEMATSKEALLSFTIGTLFGFGSDVTASGIKTGVGVLRMQPQKPETPLADLPQDKAQEPEAPKTQAEMIVEQDLIVKRANLNRIKKTYLKS